MSRDNKGSLVCVGTGIGLAGQITVIAQSHIEQADVVLGLLPDEIAEEWIQTLNPNFINLQQYYVDGVPRNECYDNMVAAIMEEVRKGKEVVGAFYGHPGVFACVPHYAITQAKKEGYLAFMEPGISAEDCLVADLGIDPGASGCFSVEATQFLFYNHQPTPNAYLILWQIAIAGDHTLEKYESCKTNLRKTVEYLKNWYDEKHEVIVYEAPFLPTQEARIEHIKLKELPNVKLSMISTLVVPPVGKLELDHNTLALFGLDETQLAFNKK